MHSLRVWKLRDYQKWKSISSWMSMMNVLRSSVMELTKPWRKFCQMKNIRPVELILHFPLDTYYVRWVLIQFFFSPSVPTPPRDLNAVLLDEERPQVHVTWKIPKEVHGNLMGYQVIWGRKGEAYQMQELPAMRQSYISDVLGLLKKHQQIPFRLSIYRL